MGYAYLYRCMRAIIVAIFCGGFLAQAGAQFSYRHLEVLYDSAWTYKRLQLIPIRFKAGFGQNVEGSSYITLSEAMQQGKAVVKELNRKVGADKRYLSITNRSKATIVVQSGELINGGKQDRVVGQTVLIPPRRKKDMLPVYCVEKKRWDDKPKPFFYGGSSETNLRRMVDVRRSQPQVWQEIDRQFEARQQASNTWSYLQLHNDSTRGNQDYVAFFTQKMAESKGGLAGFIFVLDNVILSMELFENADLTTTVFRSMLLSYTNSIGPGQGSPVVPQERLRRFADALLTTREGQQHLIKQQGNAYRHEGKLIHMVVYGDGY